MSVANKMADLARARDGEDMQFGFLLADVLRLLRKDFVERARALSLTPALYRLLFYVERHPGCRQVEIAEWLEITPVTVGRMIDRLERQGLVRRDSCPGDRRASSVMLGERARPLMTRLGRLRALTHDRAFAGLTDEEYRQLMGVLVRIRQNLAGRAATDAIEEHAGRGR